jgi:hypothetical protein
MNTKSFLLAAALLLSPASAADKPFEHGAPVALKPDLGYVLVRSIRDEHALYTANYSPVLIRMLDQTELAKFEGGDAHAAESNVVIPLADHAYAYSETKITQITPLKPGTYVLAGLANVGHSGWTTINLMACLCMGTVSFEVKPGVVTDMGTLLNALHEKPTDIPELANVVAGKPLGFTALLFDVAIRPPAPDTDTPEALKALPIVPAEYHAYGWTPNYLGAPLSRLAPLPGVLDYDKDGNAIDLKARGAKAE